MLKLIHKKVEKIRKKAAKWQNKCSSGGGQNLQNNLLTRNIKEFNIIFLILIGTLIIGLAGTTSFAFFSGETSSSGKITGKVVKKDHRQEKQL